MTIVNQRGVRVVLVAHADRELPEEVQQWLTDANNSAYSSPDIYDTLALLTQKTKPTAIIVGMDAVDWNELDFFDLSRRLSPNTHIYVTGTEHQQEKIKAACARGAKCFDPSQLKEDICKKAAPPIDHGMGGLLAGSLRTAATIHKPTSTPKPFTHVDQPHIPNKADKKEPAQQTVVRLVTPKEHDDETHKTIPFPWAPSPDRPKRTPPTPSAAPVSQRDNPKTENKHKPISVELTSEELTALLGKLPNRENNSDKEQSQ